MCTCQEYLDRLRLGLANLPRPVCDEILADFAAHFREALAGGRSEHEAAARLGDPFEIAGEFQKIIEESGKILVFARKQS